VCVCCVCLVIFSSFGVSGGLNSRLNGMNPRNCARAQVVPIV
jgi:hypothetical protein